jgi:hypothetical protein
MPAHDKPILIYGAGASVTARLNVIASAAVHRLAALDAGPLPLLPAHADRGRRRWGPGHGLSLPRFLPRQRFRILAQPVHRAVDERNYDVFCADRDGKPTPPVFYPIHAGARLLTQAWPFLSLVVRRFFLSAVPGVLSARLFSAGCCFGIVVLGMSRSFSTRAMRFSAAFT